MLAPWKKSYGRFSILKSRDITLPTKVQLVKAMVFPVVMYGCELSTEELILLNYGVREDPWESLGQQGDPTIHLKGNQSWIVIGRTDAEAEAPILWPPAAKNWLAGKDTDAGKDWRQEEKGKREDVMVESPTRWTWVWASSRSWWWTGRPGVLQSMGSQRVGHNWATELNWE